MDFDLRAMILGRRFHWSHQRQSPIGILIPAPTAHGPLLAISKKFLVEMMKKVDRRHQLAEIRGLYHRHFFGSAFCGGTF